MQLQGIGAFVTGGASGLGEATARLLHARGARVCIYDLPKSQGAGVAESLGANTHFIAGDVCDADQVGAALDETVERFGDLRALGNCAGIGSAAAGAAGAVQRAAGAPSGAPCLCNSRRPRLRRVQPAWSSYHPLAIILGLRQLCSRIGWVGGI